MFAEVILDVTAKELDRPFHYKVPPTMKEQLDLGMRVVVPFGKKTMEGIVIGFTDTPDVDEAKIRPILSMGDMENSIGPEMIRLAVWISERYMCTTSDALKAMFPVKAQSKDTWYTIASSEDKETAKIIHGLSEKERQIYQYILDHGTASLNQIKKTYGAKTTKPVVEKLIQKNLIRVSGQLRQNQKSKTISVIEVAQTTEHEILEQLKKRSPKQAIVLEYTKTHHGLTVTELSEVCEVNQSTIRTMIKKGILNSVNVEMSRDPFEKKVTSSTALKLNEEQVRALNEVVKKLRSTTHEVFLLHGVTGSGKTEIYLQAIADCIKLGRQAIVLVPEISLTPQTVLRFKARFGDQVAVMHSRLSDGERFDEWRKVKNGSVQIVVGARSAVFAPFDNLGLIVIDEEHEGTYKQEDNPKYHAREVAIARARLTNAVVILGSATPAIETYARAKSGKYKLLTMEHRVMDRPLPNVRIVDLREEIQGGNKSIFSRSLIEGITTAVEQHEQAMIFLNRRGYSTFVLCRECGLVLKCPNCNIALTMHLGDRQLLCHYCDHTQKLPETCPKCHSKNIRHFGTGTQKVEQEAQKVFHQAKIQRMDMDTTVQKGSHEKILEKFGQGEIDILIGTQMIAKGLDFPSVTLVGVVTADTALNLPDYRAAERTFQLLTQVAGRAGRGQKKGEVLIQTYNPEHYSVTRAAKHDYIGFYNEEILVREMLGYPPFYSLIRILIQGTEENNVIHGAEEFAAILRHHAGNVMLGVSEPVLGPAPAPISKLKNRYRWQICLKGKKSAALRGICRLAQTDFTKRPVSGSVSVSIDVDPLNMI